MHQRAGLHRATSWLLFLKYLDSLERDKASAKLTTRDLVTLIGVDDVWRLDPVEDHVHDADDVARDFFPCRRRSWSDNASVSLRKLLLESCNLHTVPDCPGGTFQGAGVKTVVLFFEKGAPTRKVWFYQLDPGRNMGKTNPLNDADLSDFIDRQKDFADSPKSWSVDVKGIDKKTYDLSVKKPDGGEEITHRSPKQIMEEIAALDVESAKVLKTIRGLL